MEEQEKEVRRIQIRSFILKKKSNFREVVYIPIRDTVRWKELLQYNLPEKWKINKPEAIISITGICHQFHIKDKCYFKRDLINAVTSTGSWIVTCGLESGVVQFIEDAVNEHIALKDCHIPIVGLLSKRVLAEIKKISAPDDTIVKKGMNGKWVDIPTLSTQETLDPNHTQFIFLEGKRTHKDATFECRKALERFLSNISKGYIDTEITEVCKTDIQYTETDTYEILPLVLVLIEGGVSTLETVWGVLKNGNPVVVIDGSGGAADFLAYFYRRATRESNEEKGKLSDSAESIQEVIDKCFEENCKTVVSLLRSCLENYNILLHEPVKRRKREIKQILEVGYKVKVEPFKNVFSNKTFTDIEEETQNIFKNATFENFRLTGENLTNSRMESEIMKQSSTENRDELLCGIGYYLQDNGTCISKCAGPKCGNNGQCIIDKYGKALCRCSLVVDSVISGSNCEIQTEKLALDSKYIIAITATVGTVLSIVIMITCFLYYLKRRKVKSMTKAIESVGDVEDMSQFRPSSIRGSFYTPADMYASVYKTQDKESKHQKEFDISNDYTNKIYTNTDYMITEGDVLMSPWYQSTEIFNGKEFTIKRPRIILNRASMYDC